MNAQQPLPVSQPAPALAPAVAQEDASAPIQALAQVNAWMDAAFANPQLHAGQITAVASSLSVLLQATQAAAALADAAVASAPAPGREPLAPLSLQGPEVGILSTQATADPGKEEDLAMAEEGSSKDPGSDPREPPPEARKPRCGEQEELLILS